jgi:hypothetical protein
MPIYRYILAHPSCCTSVCHTPTPSQATGMRFYSLYGEIIYSSVIIERDFVAISHSSQQHDGNRRCPILSINPMTTFNISKFFTVLMN